jgi:hypothetical protein
MTKPRSSPVPIALRRSGREIKMRIDGTDPFATAKPDARLALAANQTTLLVEMLRQNTQLTEAVKALTECVEALTVDVHNRVVNSQIG